MTTPSANAQVNSGPQGLAADGPAEDRADKMMLFGQFVGDWEAEFTVYGPEGSPMRWVFSEITEQSFRWRRVVSTDDGKT